MKSSLLLILCYVSVIVTAVGQDVIEEPWRPKFGISRHDDFENFTGINFRYISPAFQIAGEGHSLTKEEEKEPEKFKKVRIMLELLYVPPFNVCKGTCRNFIKIITPGQRKYDSIIYYVSNTTRMQEFATSFNLQYRILKYKLVRIEVVGGLKLFFLTSPGYGLINHKRNWYLNAGLLGQLDLGRFSPFVDIGIDRIYTVGTEIDLRSTSRMGKKRYKLHLRKKTP